MISGHSTGESPAGRQRPVKAGFSLAFGWALGSLGLAVILNTLNVLLIAYLTLVVGLEPALAGSLILAGKLFDVVTDLPMGWISDRTRTRWGARRPWLLAAAVVTPFALIMLFSPPRGAPGPWVLAALLLYATGYTLFNVPYLSMPAELTRDLRERTRMLALRSAFIAGGTFFGVALAPWLLGRLGGGSAAYETLGLVMAVVVGAAFLGCFLLTGRAAVTPLEDREPLGTQLRVVASNRYFSALMLIKITHLLALSIGAGSLFFFIRFALGYDLQTLGLYGAVTTLAWALSMPFWSRVANRRGKRFGYFLATCAYVLVTLTWLLAERGEPLPILLTRGFAFGVVSGGMLLMGNAMLQDVMDEDYRRTGSRKNGLFAGLYSLVEKVTAGIGAQVLGLVLSTTGFDRAVAVQPDSAVQGIYLTVALIPAALMALSLVAIWMYRMDEKALAANQ